MRVKPKIFIPIAVVVLLLIGVVIPKFTVRDLVPVEPRLKQCVSLATYLHYDNPLERLALYLGKSRIVSAMPASAEVESFTLFRIPLGVLQGQPDAKLGVFCNLIGDWRAEVISNLYLSPPDQLPLGWYVHRLNDSRIILTKQETLPDVGNTESYAYGEQIDMGVLKFDGDPQRPEDWPQLAWTEDKVLVKEKSWTQVGSMPALWIRHEPGGASGGQITWYLFADDRVYELSLYLPEYPPNSEAFSEFVYQYGEQISRQESSASSLAEQLSECLPKSDTASRERCKQLLDNIRNFDECATAGFSIMKSNPLQCATPDGRTFIQETNATWEMAIQAVNGCRVEEVFQTHSQIVTLTLKNGSKLIAAEPRIDEIMTAINTAEPKCGRIYRIGTE